MAEYISKEEAINAIKNLESSMPAKDNYAKGYDAALGRVLIAVREVPPASDVQPIVYAHKTINVGRRSYCSNCGKLAIMEDFCSKCGAKVKDGEQNDD